MSYFQKELGYIQNDEIREIAERILEEVPAYFYAIPASSTGKYHPQYALGNGGLYRHVQAAIAVAIELFRVESLWWGTLNQIEQDLVIAALLVHDGWKSGLTEARYTAHDHPEIACKVIRDLDFGDEVRNGYAYEIGGLVKTHMGQWVRNYKSSVVLQEPETKLERFVHLCDFIASRKILEVTKDVFE